MAGLKLKGLKKSYGAVKVIHGVDLEIEQGEFIVFVGRRAAANPLCSG